MSNIVPLKETKSSAFSHEGYDPATQTLAVKYHSGGVHHYADVTPEKYAQFQAAESKGSFLAREIKPNHDSAKVGGHEEV